MPKSLMTNGGDVMPACVLAGERIACRSKNDAENDYERERLH
jgi:hypothetical protein